MRSLFSRATLAVALLMSLTSIGATDSAQAASAGPAMTIHAVTIPTVTAPGADSNVALLVTNAGAAATNGTPITVTDTLPEGVEFVEVNEEESEIWTEKENEGVPTCSETSPHVVTCEVGQTIRADRESGFTLDLLVRAKSGGEGAFTNRAAVAGGGAPEVTTTNPLVIGSSPAGFGIDSFEFSATDAAGAPTTQAGAHPNLLNTGFDLNSYAFYNSARWLYLASKTAKDVVVELPMGFVGNPQAAAVCSQIDVLQREGLHCPAGSAVGLVFTDSGGARYWSTEGQSSSVSPVFNATAPFGVPAEFGLALNNVGAAFNTQLAHTSAGYVLRTYAEDLPRIGERKAVFISLFGDPNARNGVGTPRPFLTDPSDCAAAGLHATIHTDSWADPASVPLNPDGSQDFEKANFSEPQWVSRSVEFPTPRGCGRLSFHPSLEVQPTTHVAGAPSGLGVDLRVPQNEEPEGLATPPLKDATVTLPQGMVVSPSSANGLEACGEGQIELSSTRPGGCPSASKLGEVELKTPLLANPLPGSVYLGAPECSPCSSEDAGSGKLVRLYIEVNDPEVGIVVKIPGHVSVDPVTGQLTGVFDESPQLPFSDLKLTFKSGPRAPVALPASCGSSSTAAVLEPWSHAPSAGEVAGTPDAVVSDSFDVSEGCGARGFAPGFVAGTVDPQADGFSSFATSFSRSDSDQDLDAISVTTPPGLLGVLASVPLCGEPQAGEGKCSAASQIGHTVVTAGPGSAPLTVPEAGQPQAPVYLTTGYRGAPFGLSIVVPAVAGPFNLGDVVVRAAISVNPVTSQVTITSDPLPQTLDGIPLQTRTVDVSVDRPGFIFNPTNCSPSSVTGMIASAQGTTAGVSSPFEAANCATLPFKPVFSASVAGKASKAGGAALSVKVASKGGPEPGGGEANIRSVKVDLPIQLPSRQSTLKLACLAATFEANPAGCPTEADVGVATVSTPVLAHPLTGPAYLVSHGGAAFPDLEIVLQGEGIRLVLDGNTVIKKGITSSIFKTVPDAPISKFELRLPTGKYSILAAYLPNKANYSFCGQTLNMPTEITGQNGAVIKQTTKIAVTGCPKAKKTVKHKTTTKKKKKG